MSKGHIELRGVRVNNLKDISLTIPRNQLIVTTGLSGSGKSSLAFDTLYAEGHRRYVQSLSSYARQFMDRLPKPDADYISGIPPAIVIEQRTSNNNAHSTVGTSSEVYDYLRMLFARIGRIVSPITGREIVRHTPKNVIEAILAYPQHRVMLLSPILEKTATARQVQLELLSMEGFSRLYVGGRTVQIDQADAREQMAQSDHQLWLLVDRFVVNNDDESFQNRVGDSVETAFRKGEDACRLIILDEEGHETTLDFSGKLEEDGIVYQTPTPQLFSFNNPIGACPECNGFGKVLGIDEHLVIPNQSLSVYDEAVACWRGPTMSNHRDMFVVEAQKVDFPVHRPYYKLTPKERKYLWEKSPFSIENFFAELNEGRYKIQNRVLISRYQGKTICRKCQGGRLRPEANYVHVCGKSISEIADMPLSDLAIVLDQLQLDTHDAQVADRLLYELRTRVAYLLDVGLGYLTLNRPSNSLSGGETQRINLATSLGSALVGSLYILDEPSVGLHPIDTGRLISILERLRDLGNTVLVVEHDEEIIRAADHIIDIGPQAGSEGGQIVCVGSVKDLIACSESLTGAYLSGREQISLPKRRRKGIGEIRVEGIIVNNLRNVDVFFPTGALTVVTGVSGSGKSSLVREAIVPAVKSLAESSMPVHTCYSHAEIEGKSIDGVEFVDQNPLGRSSRSTPATYIKAFDQIRDLFASVSDAQARHYQSSTFSFNAKNNTGRCPACEGTGVQVVSMQFMADIEIPCPECKGTRYNQQTLEIRLNGKNIHEVLSLTITDAIAFFQEIDHTSARRIVERLQVLEDVGLGYVALGQSNSTLSGGEAQRLKLASFLLEIPKTQTLLIAFDEPTTGLHFHDIKKLMQAFDRLIDRGHTLLVIEHNVEVIKLADHIIDMGPGAGNAGGTIVASGTPEQVAQIPESVTGKFIAPKLEEKAK